MKQSESRSNSGEAQLVEQHVAALVSAGLQPRDIAVITPYNAQVSAYHPTNVLLVNHPRAHVLSSLPYH